MKCIVCQEMHVDSRWTTCIDCKNLQKFVVKVYGKSVDHKNSVARWKAIHFLQCVNTPPVIQGLNVIVDKKKKKKLSL